MHPKTALVFVLIMTAPALTQIDNRYCTAANTWVGTNADNPAIMDGPASLPTACFNTDPKNTPSPGPVVTVNPTQSLQTAYNAASCGTTIKLTSGGVWDDPFSFPAKGCDDQHWITITSDGKLPPAGYRIAPSFIPEMAQLRIARNSGLISVGDHLRFVGIYWQKNTARGGILYFFAQLKGSNKVIFDRNLFRGNPREETQHGIVTSTGKYLAVIDSWLDEFHCLAKTGACSDSQAISGGAGAAGEDITASGPVKIVNNFVEASTENIMFGGAQANGPGPQDVEIRRNYLYKPQSWNPADPSYIGDPAYIVKNCLELKNGSRMLIEGNVCENVWGGFTQKGYAILFTPKNQAGANKANLCPLCMVADITLRYNIVHTAGGAIMIGSGPNDNGAYSLGQHRTSIHNNVFDNLQYPTCYSCTFDLIELGSGYNATNPPPDGGVLSDITIDRNTFLAVGQLPGPPGTLHQQHALFQLGGIPPNVATPQVSNISFQNNVASSQDNGMVSTGGGTNNCATFAKPSTPINLWQSCYVGTSPFAGNVLIAYPSPIINWPEGNLFTPNITTVGFYDYDNGVYAVPQNSPYLGKGAYLDLVTLATWGVREQALEAPAKARPGKIPSVATPLPTEQPRGWGFGFFIGAALGFGLGILLTLVYVIVKRRQGVNS